MTAKRIPNPTHELLTPGTGCLKNPGQWVLSLTGRPVQCIHAEHLPDVEPPSPLTFGAEVEASLARMKGMPRVVIIGADVDPLIAGGDWEACALAAADHLVQHGIGLRLSTRGEVSGPWVSLLSRAATHGGAWLELGLFTLDKDLARLYEPEAPAPTLRLSAARKLHHAGVTLEVRIHPLIPWVSDTVGRLDPLFAALASSGVRRARANYLHLHSGHEKSISRLPPAHKALLGGCLKGGQRDGESRLLPHGMRTEGYRRVAKIARAHAVQLSACHDGNPDVRGASACFADPKAVADASEVTDLKARRDARRAHRTRSISPDELVRRAEAHAAQATDHTDTGSTEAEDQTHREAGPGKDGQLSLFG